MKSGISAAFTLAAAIVFGTAGYLYGSKSGAPDEAAIGAVVGTYLETHPELLANDEAPEAADADLNGTQLAAVEGLIRSHLIANPEIVSDAIAELQRKEIEAEQAVQISNITADKERIFSSPRQFVLGNPDGNVTLVEFFDYNCGYCKRAHADMVKLIEEDENLRVVLKEFPVLGEGSVEAAKVSIAVNMTAPEKFSEFHDTLLLDRGRIDGNRAIAVAEDLGIDIAKIRETMGSDEVGATIEESYQLAEKLSLTGTPSYVTAKEVVVGAVGYDILKAKIEDARDCEAATC